MTDGAWENIGIEHRDAVRSAVVEAIATARDLPRETVLARRQDEVRRIMAMAEERADKSGATFAEEQADAVKLAISAVRRQQRAKERKQARVERLGPQFIELEGLLTKVKREVTKAIAVDADLDDEHRELLADDIAELRDLLDQCRAKLGLNEGDQR